MIKQKRMKIMIISLIIVFGGLVAFNVIKGFVINYFFTHYVPPAVTISSVRATHQNWQPSISAVGNFVAVNGVDVNSQAGGQIVAIHFNSGQFIEKGSPLVDIDDAVDQAKLKFDLADLALQETNFRRQTDLLKRNATASSSVDQAQAQLLEAKANVERDQAMINLKHITAPFSGVLGIRQINLGQYIEPGKTGIVPLQSMDPIYLQFYLPEQLQEQITLNQSLLFSIEQNPGLLFAGKITAINSRVDSNTHTIEVQATIANCPNDELSDLKHPHLIKLKQQSSTGNTVVMCNSQLNASNKVTQYSFIPGMFAAIEVNQPTIPDVVVLPSTAISYTMYGDSVFIIEKQAEPDKQGLDVFTVKRVFVTTGDRQGNVTVIKQGIEPGQLVVATGELKLEDGTRVTINNDIQLPPVKNIDDLGQ